MIAAAPPLLFGQLNNLVLHNQFTAAVMIQPFAANASLCVARCAITRFANDVVGKNEG